VEQTQKIDLDRAVPTTSDIPVGATDLLPVPTGDVLILWGYCRRIRIWRRRRLSACVHHQTRMS